MSTLATDLARLLSSVRRPGDFFASGTVDLLTPRLEVDGVGPIALPLLPYQAEQLVTVAEPAPYGRGEATLVDRAVRRTWQIDPDRVRIGGKHWARTLEMIVARVADGLGVTEPVAAELYKLLVYDQGGFFVNHRDTEKTAGMFATLVIVLPSSYAGGELVVRHKGREVRLDLRCKDPAEARFAAFYADCVHEVLPVTTGCRLALIYNLVRQGRGPLPEPPAYDNEQVGVAALLKNWGAAGPSPADDEPVKLIYPLEHAYTSAALGFQALKGADAAVAGVLLAAARQSGCDLHVALLSIEESGIAEHTGGYRSYRRWSDADDEEFEAIEVCDRCVALAEWRRPDGEPPPIGEIPVEDEELSPPDALDDLQPDEEHFHEATGNEGASFERTYRRAALVLWPRDRFFAVLGQAGLPVTLPYLEDLTERWAAGGASRQSPLWHEAHDLAGQVLSDWPCEAWYSRNERAPSEATRMLTALTRTDDTEHIEALLEGLADCGGFDKANTHGIIGALSLLTPQQGLALIERIMSGTAATALDACGALLAGAAVALPRTWMPGLVGAAERLVEALPSPTHPPSRAAPHVWWRTASCGVSSRFVVDLLTALGRIDEALARHAADHILAWPQTYDLDAVLVPAVSTLIGSTANGGQAAIERLRMACLDHLRARIAEPLKPPKDWQRASMLTCSCPHCSELSRFLADPERRTWVFKAAEAFRSHVETTIRNSGCDLDTTTDRHGRPYSLICAKNQASYERKVSQRTKDLADLARLDAG
jgi:2OG-Fe(II) oxygenase superfamily